jgi:hypothetical protein
MHPTKIQFLDVIPCVKLKLDRSSRAVVLHFAFLLASLGLSTRHYISEDTILHSYVVYQQKSSLTIVFNLTPWPECFSELYRPRNRRLSAKLVPNFVDRGCHVVSATDLYCRILSCLQFIQIRVNLLSLLVFAIVNVVLPGTNSRNVQFGRIDQTLYGIYFCTSFFSQIRLINILIQNLSSVSSLTKFCTLHFNWLMWSGSVMKVAFEWRHWNGDLTDTRHASAVLGPIIER